MAKRYIDVVTKHPGEDFCQTRIENSLEALQDFVGGYIEVRTSSFTLLRSCKKR